MSVTVIFSGSSWFQRSAGEVKLYRPEGGEPLEGCSVPVYVQQSAKEDHHPILYVDFARTVVCDHVPYARADELTKPLSAPEDVCFVTHRTDLSWYLAQYCSVQKIPFSLARVSEEKRVTVYSADEFLFAIDNGWWPFDDCAGLLSRPF